MVFFEDLLSVPLTLLFQFELLLTQNEVFPGKLILQIIRCMLTLIKSPSFSYHKLFSRSQI